MFKITAEERDYILDQRALAAKGDYDKSQVNKIKKVFRTFSQIASQKLAILSEVTGLTKGEIKKLINLSEKFENKERKPSSKILKAFTPTKSSIIKLCNKGIASDNIKKGLTTKLFRIREILKNKTAVKEFRKYLKS